VHHGLEFTVVVVVVLSLLAGALMRELSRRLHVPYTIGLLLLGLLVGFVFRGELHSEHADGLGAALRAAASISPDLIIFVFLPALVFESAFALEVHGFRRNLNAIAWLAGPVLVVATVATAFAMVVLTRGSWNWSWPAGLAFGALISATDPVAVVAILRELGAPKRLGVLIEGESLLNDGTSIVVFNALIGLLAGSVAVFDLGATSLEFVRVVAGGCAVGLALGMVVTFWLRYTFNEPLVEITLTLVLAYAGMLVAEGVFHVSGVMALVSAGLWMSGIGRTRISPEVAHFLHQFWEMLAYLANTLIFLLVGLVLAAQFRLAELGELWLLVPGYVLVMAIRFALSFASLPLLARMGQKVTGQEATVISWAGLRGAVSLALALSVSQRDDIDPVVRHQILLMTAGVVFLTIVLNGSTMGRLLARYGFNTPPLAKQLAFASAQLGVLEGVDHKISELSPRLKTVNWSAVHERLGERRRALAAQVEQVGSQLAETGAAGRAAGFWQQALNVERQAYWRFFNHGMLGAHALRLLNRKIDMQLDRVTRGDPTLPESRLTLGRDPLSALDAVLRRLGLSMRPVRFDRLTLLLDLGRAVGIAAEQVLEVIDAMQGADPELLDTLRATYRGYQVEATERLEDLRVNLPEVTLAVETRMARRVQLNLERDDYHALLERGVLDPELAQPALQAVEAEMKRLRASRATVTLPDTVVLCRNTPLFSQLDDAALTLIADITRERAVARGDDLVRQGERGDSMYIIARGAVHVLIDAGAGPQLVGVLGSGDIVGEMELLTGKPRTATCRAATMVTVGEIIRSDFDALLEAQPAMREALMRRVAQRELENLARRPPQAALT
jgi:NhaP-type Na+/H+ or K+/H+ antiporter